MNYTILDYYQKFGRARNLEKYFRRQPNLFTCPNSNSCNNLIENVNIDTNGEVAKPKSKSLENLNLLAKPSTKINCIKNCTDKNNTILGFDTDENKEYPINSSVSKTKEVFVPKCELNKRSKTSNLSVDLESNIEIKFNVHQCHVNPVQFIMGNEKTHHLENHPVFITNHQVQKVNSESQTIETNISKKNSEYMNKSDLSVIADVDKDDESSIRATSPTSTIASVKGGLEWDSLADIGYDIFNQGDIFLSNDKYSEILVSKNLENIRKQPKNRAGSACGSVDKIANEKSNISEDVLFINTQNVTNHKSDSCIEVSEEMFETNSNIQKLDQTSNIVVDNLWVAALKKYREKYSKSAIFPQTNSSVECQQFRNQPMIASDSSKLELTTYHNESHDLLVTESEVKILDKSCQATFPGCANKETQVDDADKCQQFRGQSTIVSDSSKLEVTTHHNKSHDLEQTESEIKILDKSCQTTLPGCATKETQADDGIIDSKTMTISKDDVSNKSNKVNDLVLVENLKIIPSSALEEDQLTAHLNNDISIQNLENCTNRSLLNEGISIGPDLKSIKEIPLDAQEEAVNKNNTKAHGTEESVGRKSQNITLSSSFLFATPKMSQTFDQLFDESLSLEHNLKVGIKLLNSLSDSSKFDKKAKNLLKHKIVQYLLRMKCDFMPTSPTLSQCTNIVKKIIGKGNITHYEDITPHNLMRPPISSIGNIGISPQSNKSSFTKSTSTKSTSNKASDIDNNLLKDCVLPLTLSTSYNKVSSRNTEIGIENKDFKVKLRDFNEKYLIQLERIERQLDQLRRLTDAKRDLIRYKKISGLRHTSAGNCDLRMNNSLSNNTNGNHQHQCKTASDSQTNHEIRHVSPICNSNSMESSNDEKKDSNSCRNECPPSVSDSFINRSEQKSTYSISYTIIFNSEKFSNPSSDINSKSEINKLDGNSSKSDSSILNKLGALQEYLKISRPNFLLQAERRRKHLLETHTLRQKNYNLSKKMLYECREVLPSNTTSQALARKQLFTTKYMRSFAKKYYVNLPEIKQKTETEHLIKLRKSNRIRTAIFNKNLQHLVLSGQINLSNSVQIV